MYRSPCRLGVWATGDQVVPVPGLAVDSSWKPSALVVQERALVPHVSGVISKRASVVNTTSFSSSVVRVATSIPAGTIADVVSSALMGKGVDRRNVSSTRALLAGCTSKAPATSETPSDSKSGYGMGGVEQKIYISKAAVVDTPRPWNLKTPESAVRSYLDWVSYAYRVGESEAATSAYCAIAASGSFIRSR